MVTLSDEVRWALETYVVREDAFLDWWRSVNPSDWTDPPKKEDVADYIYTMAWLGNMGGHNAE